MRENKKERRKEKRDRDRERDYINEWVRGYIYDKREHFNKTGYIKSKCNHSLTTSSDSLCLLLLHRYAIGEDPSQMYGPAPYNLWWVA